MTKPSVPIVVDTHFELDTSTIKVDNQMAIIQVLVADVVIDGGASVNIIIENLKTKLGLPKPRPAPYHFRMAN
jgi:hypothetical protein